jgi:CBS domain-containing protein
MLVRHRMTRDPVTVTPDDTLARALRLTRERRVRHLPVVDGAGRLEGILSEMDILGAFTSPVPVGGKRTVILHVSSIDPREAIQALRAAGFEVGWPSLEEDLGAG